MQAWLESFKCLSHWIGMVTGVVTGELLWKVCHSAMVSGWRWGHPPPAHSPTWSDFFALLTPGCQSRLFRNILASLLSGDQDKSNMVNMVDPGRKCTHSLLLSYHISWPKLVQHGQPWPHLDVSAHSSLLSHHGWPNLVASWKSFQSRTANWFVQKYPKQIFSFCSLKWHLLVIGSKKSHKKISSTSSQFVRNDTNIALFIHCCAAV